METFMGGSSFSYSSSTSSVCSTSTTYHHQPPAPPPSVRHHHHHHSFSNGTTFPGAFVESASAATTACCNLNRRESESYVAVKGQSLIVTRSEGQKRGLCRRPSAVALNGPLAAQVNMKSTASSDDQLGDAQAMSDIASNNDNGEIQTMSEIERHLHQMTQLLRPQDSIKLVVRLESSISSRIRYLAVVSCMEQDVEEYCLLGMDCNGDISLRLVLAILSHTIIRLDGDGGFCVQDGDGLRSHIFKPVSVQTMWSALQSLYRASEFAKRANNYQVVAVKHYESLFQETARTDVGYFNEWNTLPGVENGRKPVDTSLSEEELAFQQKISTNLRQILIAEEDLDEVTSKQIRTKLEAKMKMDLTAYKSFIDEEMMKILGQLDAPASITDNLFLGTEWNASHQQDLFEKQIGCILNVTSEIDNFFPDSFHYMNIPVIDTEETNLLRYFNDSYRFINGAHKEGKNVLVHCKMGISRSATIVIAYVMKNKKWDLRRSLKHVQERRNCIRPNPNFMKQLEVYEGILKAKRNGNVLEKRSKSESNLKQTEFSLKTRKDSNSSNSNSSLNGLSSAKKSQQKYYNTAPARLRKPDKFLRVDANSSLCRAKSASCATISMANNSRDEDSSMEELVTRDVMDSFRSAVNCLEKFPPTSPKKVRAVLPQNDNVTVSHTSPVSLHASDEPATSVTFTPHLTRNSNSAPTFVSQTLIMPQVSSEVQATPKPQPPVEIYIEPAEPIMSPCPANEPPTKMDELDFSSLTPHAPGDSSVQTWLATTTSTSDTTTFNQLEFDQSMSFSNFDGSATPPGSRRNSHGKSNLKSCRHPFNGHTFSVSPNQVLNITSLADLSKFSVRHLVNEFELYSNRKNFVNENSTSGFPLPVSLISNSEPGSKPIYKSWVNIESTNSNELNNSQPSKPEPELEGTETERAREEAIPGAEAGGKSGEDLSRSVEKFDSVDTIIGEAAKAQATGDEYQSEANKNLDSEETSAESVIQTPPSQGSSSPPSSFNHSRSTSGSVVKQRLQAFEAKTVPDHRRVHNASIMSHHRTQSGGATNTSPSSLATGTFPPLATPRHSNNQGHCKKLSLPHITTGASTTTTSSAVDTTATPVSADSSKRLSPPIYSTYFPNYHTDRKGSLDSSTLHNFKTIPNRPVQVRGFASHTITSSNKITLPSTAKLRGGAAGTGVGLGAVVKQEHGSTHPLKLLPQTAKLTQNS